MNKTELIASVAQKTELTKKDAEKTLSWQERIAKRGDAETQYQLGKYYLTLVPDTASNTTSTPAKPAQAAATVEEPEPAKSTTPAPTVNTQNGNLTMDELLNAINAPAKGIEEESKIQNEILKKYPNDERDILFIGDSVLDMTKIDLRKKYPNAIIETKVGRQFY